MNRMSAFYPALSIRITGTITWVDQFAGFKQDGDLIENGIAQHTRIVHPIVHDGGRIFIGWEIVIQRVLYPDLCNRHASIGRLDRI